MAGQILELRGCTPEPLGNYLKGLGVFRLIAEQADPQACMVEKWCAACQIDFRFA